MSFTAQVEKFQTQYKNGRSSQKIKEEKIKMDLFENATIEELAEEQKKAAQAKEDYPALAELDNEVLLQLAVQNFKCSMCGEPVLNSSKPSYVVRFKDYMEVEYGVVFQTYLPEPNPEDCEIIMSLNEA